MVLVSVYVFHGQYPGIGDLPSGVYYWMSVIYAPPVGPLCLCCVWCISLHRAIFITLLWVRNLPTHRCIFHLF